MSRAPSDATMLRSARKEIRDLERQIAGTIKDREAYRIRATKAEQECAEWKRRFDMLLADRASPRQGTTHTGDAK